MSELLKKKTTWVGVLMILSAIVNTLWTDQGNMRLLGAHIQALSSDPQLWAGLALITGRDALRKALGK